VSGAIDNGVDAEFAIRANNADAIRIRPEALSPTILGGHSTNSVTADVSGVVIGGGGAAGLANAVYDDFGVVGGGLANAAGDDDGVTAAQSFATVVGGQGNAARGTFSTIGGGQGNTAGGPFATVAGGASNTIDPTSTAGAIPGGALNVVTGTCGFAAGQRAMSLHDGTFVWADTQPSDFLSTGTDQFLVRAVGGIWLGDAGPVSFPVGSYLATGTGAYLSNAGIWTSVSDRARKEGFRALDGASILDRVVSMPVTEWRFKGEDATHIGPVAQDFHAAFGLGDSETTIAATDLAGVALAAIQQLERRLRDVEARLDEAESRCADCPACRARTHAAHD
jgi:hypothetical protein